jgi:hypothetical protein
MISVCWLPLIFGLSAAPLSAEGVKCSALEGINAQEFAMCMQDPESAEQYRREKNAEAQARGQQPAEAPAEGAGQAARWRDQWQSKFEKYYALYDRVTPLLWGQAGGQPGWEDPSACAKRIQPGSAMQSLRLQGKFVPIVSEMSSMDALFGENSRLIKEVMEQRHASCSGTLADSRLRPDNWMDPFCPWLKTMLCGEPKKSGGLKQQWGHIKRSLLNAGKCASDMGIGKDNTKYEEIRKVPVSARYEEMPPQTDCSE